MGRLGAIPSASPPHLAPRSAPPPAHPLASPASRRTPGHPAACGTAPGRARDALYLAGLLRQPAVVGDPCCGAAMLLCRGRRHLSARAPRISGRLPASPSDSGANNPAGVRQSRCGCGLRVRSGGVWAESERAGAGRGGASACVPARGGARALGGGCPRAWRGRVGTASLRASRSLQRQAGKARAPPGSVRPCPGVLMLTICSRVYFFSAARQSDFTSSSSPPMCVL